jgi:hypothetical protein
MLFSDVMRSTLKDKVYVVEMSWLNCIFS